MFIFLGKGFWIESSQIQAVEYMHSETLDHTFLKVFCKESVYDFQGERAKEAWVIVQKALELKID